ncbi:hypothetical protein ABEF92_005215 [Exophiala dermatitidis]|uniref:Uncharacterized protein n=2 Tax=Exophiala dermatitidis TaxID=5970 RepID=H6C603_EXODN|nr:uncharacterized protein HMPREF1120_07147 [Exophiala dermatitidis NIH/UT8656]EHY59149.1 hypothetical protein HMPREF1120_07147 [Exophiala dermatitidis NIH/UT8656]KAJ4560030.1 hypothetical protein HRR78_000554 [Exophiala dermatitidis]
MPTSKDLIRRSRAKVSSVLRKVSSTTSQLLRHHSFHHRNVSPIARLVQEAAAASPSSSVTAPTPDPIEEPATTTTNAHAPIPAAETVTQVAVETTAPQVSGSILRFVDTNYIDGSSIADVSSTESSNDDDESSQETSGQRGGATSGPGLYYREYTFLNQRRAADNFALWPIESELTLMNQAQPRNQDGPSSIPLVLDTVPANSPASGILQSESARTGSPLPLASRHGPKPSVSDDVNAQIFRPRSSIYARPPTPFPRLSDILDASSAPQVVASSSCGEASSSKWSHRTPAILGDNFVLTSGLIDPFVEQGGSSSARVSEAGPRSVQLQERTLHTPSPQPSLNIPDPRPTLYIDSPQPSLHIPDTRPTLSLEIDSEIDSETDSETHSPQPSLHIPDPRPTLHIPNPYPAAESPPRRWSDFSSDEFPSAESKHLVRVNSEEWELQPNKGKGKEPERRWSDFDSDEFPSTRSKHLVRVNTQEWELQPNNDKGKENERRWSDFDSDEFPSAESKHLVRVGSQQWELQHGRPRPQPQGPAAAAAPAPAPLNHEHRPEHISTININDPEGYGHPVVPGALAGDWSLPSSIQSEGQHLRHMERGLFAAQNALPAIRGLRYAVDRAATDFQALALENQALHGQAAEWQFKATRVLEPELLMAWEALRHRDAEIDRLRRIIAQTSDRMASRSDLNVNDTAADFHYQGHHLYNANANANAPGNTRARAATPQNANAGNTTAPRTPPSQIYGSAQLQSVYSESEWEDVIETDSDDMYGP